MKLATRFSDEVLERVMALYVSQENNAFVQRRQAKNVDGNRPEITQDEVWHKLVMAQLTTQQRSGPNSAINRFLDVNPFPLCLMNCERVEDLEAYIRCKLRRFGGIRFCEKIARYLNQNFQWLNFGDGWERVMTRLIQLEGEHSKMDERRASWLLAHHFDGIGPKQSRNVLQMLGLSKYEIPLDSRIAGRLNEVNFPIYVEPKLLSNENYYCRVLDLFQELCEELGLLPCMLDAAMFASYDDGWNEGNVD